AAPRHRPEAREAGGDGRNCGVGPATAVEGLDERLCGCHRVLRLTDGDEVVVRSVDAEERAALRPVARPRHASPLLAVPGFDQRLIRPDRAVLLTNGPDVARRLGQYAVERVARAPRVGRRDDAPGMAVPVLDQRAERPVFGDLLLSHRPDI